MIIIHSFNSREILSPVKSEFYFGDSKKDTTTVDLFDKTQDKESGKSNSYYSSMKDLMERDTSVRVDRITSGACRKYPALKFACTEMNKNRLSIPAFFVPISDKQSKYIDEQDRQDRQDRTLLCEQNRMLLCDDSDEESSNSNAAIAELFFAMTTIADNKQDNKLDSVVSFCNFDTSRYIPFRSPTNIFHHFNNFCCIEPDFWVKDEECGMKEPRCIIYDAYEYNTHTGIAWDGFPGEDLDTSIDSLVELNTEIFTSTLHAYMNCLYRFSKKVDNLHLQEWDDSFECPSGDLPSCDDYEGFFEYMKEKLLCGETEIYFVTRKINYAEIRKEASNVLYNYPGDSCDHTSNYKDTLSDSIIYAEQIKDNTVDLFQGECPDKLPVREVIAALILKKVDNEYSRILDPTKYLLVESIYVSQDFRGLNMFEFLMNVIKNNTDLHINNTDGHIRYPGFIIDVSPANKSIVSVLENKLNARQRRVEYVFE